MINFSGVSLETDAIVNYLKKDLRLKEICQKILEQKVIEEAAHRKNVQVTPEEIQIESERQRQERRLEKAADTLAWLAEQLIKPEDWEAGIREHLLTRKLANYLFYDQAKQFFTENQLNFNQALLYQLTVTDEKLATELFYQIQEQEISFYEAAHLYDLHETRKYQCGYEGKFCRWQLKPDISVVVFGAKPREVIRPLKVSDGYSLLMVEEFIQPELTLEIHQELINNMFQEWLANELNYVLYDKVS